MSSPINAPSTPGRTNRDDSPQKRSAFGVNMKIALLVWATWLLFGRMPAIHHMFVDWRVALTMAFGSLVGGGTSEGGGAIAFPIFTKLLHIAPYDARNFSLAIQSVGMGSASLSILYLRIPIERRVLLYAGLPGVVGVVFGAYFIAPLIPPVIVRTSFTVLVSSLGVALLLVNRNKTVLRNLRMPVFEAREKGVLIAAGLVGGVVSALVGTGENTVAFMVMVLLFRLSEKVVTPTTVILMTMVTIPGFLFHLFVLKDIGATVMGYWLAAVPVVAVGAPLGALICSRMTRHSVVAFLLFLIALEFTSTMLIVPMSRFVLLTSLAMLVVCGALDWAMSRTTRYQPQRYPSSLAGSDTES
jgi:uncharacterized membrane protein YfcA